MSAKKTMSKPVFLGIDTSNYTTSAALFGDVVFNGKQLLPVAEGRLGLRQSDAVFNHTKQLPVLIEEAFHKLNGKELAAVGVSVSPRESEDSYMPCFLAGLGAARMLSSALKAPLYEFSHQQGHVAAALFSAGRLDLLENAFIAFHISGGTTEALMVKPDDCGIPRCSLLAGSLDLKAGQAVDRAGVMLGLGFPAGREMDALASKSLRKFKIRPSVKGNNISLSGVENKCRDMINAGECREDVAAFCIESVIAGIDACAAGLIDKYGRLPMVFSGGVSSNSMMRKRFEEKYSAVFAEPEYSADNGMGAAVLASIKHQNVMSGMG